ncbi:hypothetical protein WK78_29730 [Burkholderia cepacia]|nr:hypothetical protein WK78_29730 [Burkholderia cepacia]
MNGVKSQVQAVGCLQWNCRKSIRLLLERIRHMQSTSPLPKWLDMIIIVSGFLALRGVKSVSERMDTLLRFPKEEHMET